MSVGNVGGTTIMYRILDLVNEVQGTKIKIEEEFRIKDYDLTFKFHFGTLFCQEKGFSWCEDDGKYLKKIITEKSVIERKLKKMSFADALKMILDTKKTMKSFCGVKYSERDHFYQLNFGEIENLWTVEGVYENE